MPQALQDHGMPSPTCTTSQPLLHSMPLLCVCSQPSLLFTAILSVPKGSDRDGDLPGALSSQVIME